MASRITSNTCVASSLNTEGMVITIQATSISEAGQLYRKRQMQELEV